MVGRGIKSKAATMTELRGEEELSWAAAVHTKRPWI